MTNRFNESTGCHFNPEVLCDMTDEELAKAIRDLSYWDEDLVRDLCWRADIPDEEYNAAESPEDIVYKAAEILHVEI